MTAYHLNDVDTVVLMDPKTGQLIHNCTRILGDQLGNNKVDHADHENLLRAHSNGLLQPIDVRKSDSRFGHARRDISWDTLPMPKELRSFATAFVQNACIMAAALESGKDVIIYCKNGRSRSPCVVAAFYLLFRGFSLAHIKKWFGEAYPAQRPLTAEKSSVFPNLHKFLNVLHLLIDCIQVPTNTVRGFNLDGEQCLLIDTCFMLAFSKNIDLELIGARCNVNDQYPWVINNTSGLHQTAIPSRQNDNAQVYHSPKRVLTRHQRRLNSEAAASNKKLKTDENEVVADDVEVERIGHDIAPLAASLAVLYEEIAITPSKFPNWLPPDWLTKFWPLGDYHETKAFVDNRLHLLPVQVAITSLSIPACSRILSKLGAQSFFHDIMLWVMRHHRYIWLRK